MGWKVFHKDLHLTKHEWFGHRICGVCDGSAESDGEEWVLYGLIDFDGESDKLPVMEYDRLQVDEDYLVRGWDIVFEGGDLKRVDGTWSLRSGIVFACLTAFDELKEHIIYSGRGNKAYNRLYHPVDDMVKKKIASDFKEVLRRMYRIERVNRITVDEYKAGRVLVGIDVLARTGENINIDLIMTIP